MVWDVFPVCERLEYYCHFVNELSSIKALELVLSMGSGTYILYCEDSHVDFDAWEQTGGFIA